MSAPEARPTVGAKFEMLLRVVLLKKTLERHFFSITDTKKVLTAVTSVSRAFVNVVETFVKVRPTSETASITNIVLMRTENISSVNLVKYLTRFDADVIEQTRRMKDDQSPVHAYNGKNGSPIALVS
jgi:hypothetical protein